MKDYLYILPFENEDYFKIGISSDNFNRVITHHQTFTINLNSVTIIQGSKKNIRTIERILLSLYPEIENNPYHGKDGATEIRHVNDLEQCFNDVKYWSERLDLVINTPKKEEIKPKNINNPRARLSNEEKLIRQQKSNILDQKTNVANLKSLKNIIEDIFISNHPDNIEFDSCSPYTIKINIHWVKENIPSIFYSDDYKNNIECKNVGMWIRTSSANGTLGHGIRIIGNTGHGEIKVNGHEHFALFFDLIGSQFLSTNEHESHVSIDFLNDYTLFESWFKNLITPYIDKDVTISAYERPIPKY